MGDLSTEGFYASDLNLIDGQVDRLSVVSNSGRVLSRYCGLPS
jgi:hypothetical protein